MRFHLARLTRSVIGFIVRHSGEETRMYLRHAGIAVEEFTDPLESLTDQELEELFVSPGSAS